MAWAPEAHPADRVQQAPWWIMLVITLVTLYSFVDYFQGNYQLLRAAWSDDPVR